MEGIKFFCNLIFFLFKSHKILDELIMFHVQEVKRGWKTVKKLIHI